MALVCHTPLDPYFIVLQNLTADHIHTPCICAETIFPKEQRDISTTQDTGDSQFRAAGAIRPANFDFSNTVGVRVSFKGGKGTWNICYIPKSDARYPSHTQGILYSHHPQEIRFRLCQNVQQFDQGTDLLLPNGQVWSILLPDVLEKHAEAQRSVILDLTSDERLSHSNWHILPGRHITTLSPANFTNQQIFDLSSCIRASVYTGPTGNHSFIHYYSSKAGHFIPFPDGSAGLFYYKQSTIAPTRVGELRFRLCNDILSFGQGTDLLFPSGNIWHLSSEQLLLLRKYSHIRDLLSKEGILDCRLYPDIIRDAIVISTNTTPHLLRLSQPFIVDLAQCRFTIYIWVGSRFERILSAPIFKLPQGGKAAYRGRAVVRLEVPPGQSLLDMTSDSETKPLFVLHFLEMLTPIERNPECLDDSYMAHPEPGQLNMRRHRRTHHPWAYYTSSDKVRQHWRSFRQQSSEAPV